MPAAAAQAADFLNGGGRPSQLPAGANRPSQLPSGPGTGNIAGRPGVGGPGVGGPGVGGPGVGGPGVGRRRQTRVSGHRDRRRHWSGHWRGIGAGIGNNLGDRRGDFANNRPDRVENRQELHDNRQQRRDKVRDQVGTIIRGIDFWLDHPNWAAWRINAPYRWATWGALTGWFGWGTGYTETPYAYGDNVYYSGDQVYYGDQPYATAEEYANQAAAIADSAPENLNPQASDWLPLGVFAVTQDRAASGSSPTLFIQLAVNKEGVISGTFKNEDTGETQTLEGMVDKEKSARRLVRARQVLADRRDRPVESHGGHVSGAAAFRRRPDSAMAVRAAR